MTPDAVEHARHLDEIDPLREFRNEFVIDDPEVIYLDGNSLGRLPKRTSELLRHVVDKQWGGGLVTGWSDWIDLPKRIGAKIARLIGADEDEVLVCDSTSVNFYKLTMAALGAKPGGGKILTDSANFPSDLYILQGCAHQTGRTVEVVEPEAVLGSISPDVALVTLTHTSFKSGYIHPMAEVTQAAHDAGATMLWDLCHSVGSVPVDLHAGGADLAVGCTYKYLNGGPGSPAFLYVRRDLQETLVNPIWGWFGQRDAFDFSLEYSPAPGLQRFMAGTPPILSMAAVECGVDLILEAGIERLRAKSMLQTQFLVDLWETHLEPLGFTLNSPRDSAIRGSHVSIGHPDAYRIDQALIHDMKVIPDFRSPDNIRLGITPISTTFTEIAEAVSRTKQVMEGRLYERYPSQRSKVT
jgi:kynureninase